MSVDQCELHVLTSPTQEALLNIKGPVWMTIIPVLHVTWSHLCGLSRDSLMMSLPPTINRCFCNSHCTYSSVCLFYFLCLIVREFSVLRNVSPNGLDDIWIFVFELFQQDFSAQHRFGIEIKKLCVCVQRWQDYLTSHSSGLNLLLFGYQHSTSNFKHSLTQTPPLGHRKACLQTHNGPHFLLQHALLLAKGSTEW